MTIWRSRPAEIFSSATTHRRFSDNFRTIRIFIWDSVIASKQSVKKYFFFAGGGTGGHLYPAIAVAGQIAKLEPSAHIHFLCSTRDIDKYILSQTGFDYTILPAKAFTRQPGKLLGFLGSILKSYKIADRMITQNKNSAVIGLGGFVSGPVCLAARRRKVPIALLNVDIVPGRANKIIARWAEEIFVQFEDTAKYFNESKVRVVGCPLREDFRNPQPEKAIEQTGLDKNKKTLLITGASSGSANINHAICSVLEKMDAFADSWQIVHLTGRANLEQISGKNFQSKINYKILGYFDEMPNLLAAANLVIGRSGAVSVAEFAAAGVPAICIPYPYHKDKHQYLNAGKLVKAGAAVIVDDLPDKNEFSERLWNTLENLMKDDKKRQQMAKAAKSMANPQADLNIAEKLIKIIQKQ
ncbi:MAG: undecaprenyldiphospho-muramoylpentapeptide beta-N-acetylglucosaminyltransferase [Sedimentisphaerales bacterium]|nr:undecaprenyldiphospho-muramoylpentapeptide beta-N-acetylglucosaminyltransferase [Sedimentisphaerales bacterium]